MIRESHETISSGDSRVIVHPTAGGKIRGAHNCGSCDKDVVAAIERYSVSSDLDEFSNIDCSCKSIWRDEIRSDLALPAQFGTGLSRRGNPQRLLRAP
jgi:hypothetical protein